MMLRRCVLVSSMMMVAACLGCGGAESIVTGKVTLDGRPLETGVVTFHPKTDGPVAYGTIHPRGSYSLKTGGSRGLAAGDYVVTVTASAPIDAAQEIPRGSLEVVGELLVLAKYTTKRLTDLSATVKPGANEVNLALHTK